LKEFYVPYKRSQEDLDKLDTLVKGYETEIKDNVQKENEAIQLESITQEKLAKSFHKVGL